MTRIKIEDLSVLEELDSTSARGIFGGRCWDGPLGDRDECPEKPSSTHRYSTGGIFTITVTVDDST